MKPSQPPYIAPTTVERRTLLRWFGGSAVLALGGDLLAACGGAISTNATDAGTTGTSDTAGSDFAFQPGPDTNPIYTDWTENTVDPQDLVDLLANWSLTIDGMVANPLTLRFADLMALGRQDQVTDFHCVVGWSVLDVPWNGVSLASILDRVAPTPSASHITFHSVGETYSESLPLSVAREPFTLLAYGVAGSTLPLEHGFPLRLVVPRLLGYKNAKYLSRLEITDHEVMGFWEKSGYPYDGEVSPTRLRAGKY
jgi:DMSO/TMAO reductase YedYZ molybdopterin-dependent catalytic subunit